MTVRGRLAAMVAAAHPIPGASVSALVGALVAARGGDAPTVALALASTAAGQASVGWSNDFLDRFEDARVGRMDKPLVDGRLSAELIRRAAAAAFACSVALSVPLGLLETVLMAVAVGSAWAYNLGLKRTVVSWLPYAASFGLLPVYVWVATGQLAPAWLVGGAALLGVAGHLTNVLPDLDQDRVLGRRGLPQVLGSRVSLFTACALLLAVLVLVLAAGGGSAAPSITTWTAAGVAAALIVGVFVSVRGGRPRAGFHLTIAAAAAIAAVLLLSLRAA